MKPVHTVLAAGAVALLALGALAGSVVGDDGAVGLADRIDADPGSPERQLARPAAPRGAAAGSRKRKRAKKPVVFHGAGQINELGPGESRAISLVCPKRFKVPVSAGLDSSGGVYASSLTRYFGTPRAMLIAVVNPTGEAHEFRATSVCMKRVKENG